MAQTLFAKTNVEVAKQKEVLEKIENCSKGETEKVLVREFGTQAKAPKRELVQTCASEEALLHVRLSQSTLAKLDRLKSLRAHKNPRMSYAELIDDMCEYMLKKLDPMVRPPKAKPAQSPSNNPRYIPPSLKTRSPSACARRRPGDRKKPSTLVPCSSQIAGR